MAYIVMAAASVVMLVVSWGRGITPVKVGVFLLTGGAIGVVDFLLNGFLHLYTYHPYLLPQELPDQRLGELLSDCLFVPAVVSSFIEASMRHWWVSALQTAALAGVEVVTLYIGAFTHTRWSTWLTVILFLLFLFLINAVMRRFERVGYDRLFRAGLIIATLNFAINLWGLVTVQVLNLTSARLYLLASPTRDSLLTGLLIHFAPLLAIGIPAVWLRWTRDPVLMILIAGLLFAMAYGTVLLGIAQVRAPWSPLYNGIGSALIIWGTGLIDGWFSGETVHMKADALR